MTGRGGTVVARPADGDPGPASEVLVREDRVHRRLYTDAGVFALELERIFERTWVFVGHESEVPQPGDYRTTAIGRQPVILSRHTDGSVHVLFNRCMHRGAVVCRAERGNSTVFRCMYHGWMYDPSGELVGVPFPGGYGDGFDPAEWGLRRVPRVESRRGFVFASLAPEGEGLAEHLGPAARYLDLIVDAAPAGEVVVRAGVERYAYAANWKLQAENLLDGYHPNFTHQVAFEIAERRRGRSGRRANSEGSGATARAFGRGHGALHYGAARRYAPDPGDPAAAAHRRALEERLGPERAEEVLGTDIQLFVFPNLFFQNARQHFRVLRPVAVDRTEVEAYPYALSGAPDEVNRRQVRGLAWWASSAAFGQPDDLEAFERCQAGLQVTAADWVLFARGLHRERQAAGEVVGDVTDEVPQRGMYREWKRLMADGDA